MTLGLITTLVVLNLPGHGAPGVGGWSAVAAAATTTAWSTAAALLERRDQARAGRAIPRPGDGTS